MALAINDAAPDFEAQTTEGRVRFHGWIGNNWAVLFFSPQGFHARVHDGTWPHGQDQAGIRQTRREDHWALG